MFINRYNIKDLPYCVQNMTDRRARLRPKAGARSLYYGTSGNNNSQSVLPWANTLRGSTLQQNNELPWISNRAFSENAPNAPIQNTVTVDGSATSADAQGIAQALNESGRTSELINRALSQSGSFDADVYDTGNLLAPLALTDGMVWPYTPTINLSQAAEYTTYDPIHTNNEYYAYARTRAPQIGVAGQFSVQNTDEARYALAAIHFLRTVVKMSFGEESRNPGTPPPILLFSAYGDYMFNDIPVIVQTYTVDFDQTVNYVRVPNTNTWLPTVFNVAVTLVPQYTPSKSRTFNIDQFRTGSLMKRKGWI